MGLTLKINLISVVVVVAAEVGMSFGLVQGDDGVERIEGRGWSSLALVTTGLVGLEAMWQKYCCC